LALNETQQQLQDTVHKFAQEHLAPRAAQIDKDNAFPMV
jgi:isovaleryl-CoA dehydrogenase